MLARTGSTRRRVTLVPLIDVLFILLVYFMVTSVYRDLDMIPVVRAASVGTTPQEIAGTPLMLRIDAQGRVVMRGQNFAAADLADMALGPSVRVLVLPSGAAPLWALTDLMDALSASGVEDVRLVQLEGQE
ncbi:biopolymer transporter ExbD [Pseudosulfitobacter sp. DSM 107133]|uniref:ExbD/TolR family protein n=1 Tax=Pseudosulfitobacter sp. DSM 107133 TaxID=2883100 RepID=UPI000DF38834|nr:biopolymer transporter ExbD [Pseudosulfitobacter sp. DSM 107133]UOA28968.1 hypothetical protein DSM107133_03727 [Pseudosulfitobacter sp. DSM 107133]